MPLVNLKLSGLLYSPYGMGLTMIGLYALLCALEKRCLRLPAGAVLAASLFPVIPFALNGFLHARGKILIPFLLLVCLIFARLLEEYFVGKDVPKVWAGMICLIPCIALKGKYGMWQYADWGILMLWILLVRQGYRLRRPRLEKTRCTQRLTAALLLVLCSFSFCLNTEMGFVSQSQIKTEAIRKAFDEANALMNENRRGNAGNYRFEILTDAFNLCNFLPGAEAKRSSMYSSITQQDYAKFFYDGAKNSIPIQNRVALISRENALFNYKMGVRYILTDKDSIPKGYRKISESGKAARGGDGKIRAFLSRRFYKICEALTGLDTADGEGDFRLMNRQVMEAILALGERERYTKGSFSFVGFRTKWVEFESVERKVGESKWNLRGLLRYAVDGILAFSTVPLHLAGVFAALLTVAAAAVLLSKTLTGSRWAVCAAMILGCGALQMLVLYLFGLYFARAYSEIKARPLYIVRERSRQKTKKCM